MGEKLDKQIFEKAVNFVFKVEGHFSNDKDDPGGLTKYGISKKQFPNLDIKNLTIDQAKEIYYEYYWKKASCDKICQLSPQLAIIVFDTQVNSGNGIKLLQITIKQFPDKHFKKITIDGVYGPQTESLLKDLLNIAPNFVIFNYLLNRVSYYNMITGRKPKLKKFLRGWLNRINELKMFILNNLK